MISLFLSRTPLAPNNCELPKYILEDHIGEISDFTQAQIDPTDPRCSTQLSNSIDEERMNVDLFESESNSNLGGDCGDEDLNTQRIGALQQRLDRAMEVKRRIRKDFNFEDREWLTTKYFDVICINDIKIHQSDLIQVNDVLPNMHWFHYMKNDLEPELSRYCFYFFTFLNFSLYIYVCIVFRLKKVRKEWL